MLPGRASLTGAKKNITKLVTASPKVSAELFPNDLSASGAVSQKQ